MKTVRHIPVLIACSLFALSTSGCMVLAAPALLAATAPVGIGLAAGISAVTPEEYKLRNSPNYDKPPKVGMTKDQVIGLYGKPNRVTRTARGETWSYQFRTPVKKWNILIEETRRARGTVIFNTQGKVSNYIW